MTTQEHERQYDGSADGGHRDPAVLVQGQYDPLTNVLVDPRPWPALNGAQWLAVLFCGEIALMVGAWLVTK